MWLLQTDVSTLHQHQRANTKYERLCFNRAPQQHDLNATVSFASPTVTARRLENLTSAGSHRTVLYTVTALS